MQFLSSKASIVLFMVVSILSGSLSPAFAEVNAMNAANTAVVASAENPYRANLSADYAARIDKMLISIFARGKGLSRDQYVTYLASLSNGIAALVQKPAYQNSLEVKNITGYLIYEIDQEKNRITGTAAFMDDLSKVASDTPSGQVASVDSTTVISPKLTANQPPVLGGADDEVKLSFLSQKPTDNTLEVEFEYDIGKNFTKCFSPDPVPLFDINGAGTQLQRHGTYKKVFTASTVTGITCYHKNGATVSSKDLAIDVPGYQAIGLAVVGLGMGSEWYVPVKVGKTLTINYYVKGVDMCRGWYSRTGETRGMEVQFRTSGSVSNYTYLSEGTFDLSIDYPTHLEFSCWGHHGKLTKEIIEFKTKAHDDTDTYIDVNKETIAKAGETLTIDWQANPVYLNGATYCHIAKTHTLGGVRSPNVFLDKDIDLSSRIKGSITDTITTPGRYVYAMTCDNVAKASNESGITNGMFITSKAVTFSGP